MGNGKWEIRIRKSEIGNQNSEIGIRKSEIGNRKSENQERETTSLKNWIVSYHCGPSV